MITDVSELIQRVSPTKEEIRDSVAYFDEKISKEFKQKAETEEKRAHLVTKISEPYKTPIIDNMELSSPDFKSLKELALNEHELHRLNLKEEHTDVEERARYMLRIDERYNIMGPPYDVDWTSGAVGYAHQNIGEFGITPFNGQVAAAIGIFISPLQNVIGRFTAYVPITFSWFSWIINSGYSSTNGGIGVMIYDVKSGQPLLDNRAKLWNNTLVGAGFENESESTTYLSSTSAAESYFAMTEGDTYLVWIWCWGEAKYIGSPALSMASIAGRIPFVAVQSWPTR
ncbi:MAG: hypothetical protein J7604_07870 [Sporocytophaga sp.]|uniref:hypothetical protein n=1 Tax=Sporocytophaga sp. TaxID=2231183 RepID=UPI001B08EC56|nr:hypothetical protein [Sporocytophaga sp.]MBO9700114.1 hypothetical protein [Sporocytophaga sp.]